MVYAHMDEKTRITLTKEVASHYDTEDFVVVPMKNEILLIPVSKDPIKSLQEEGKKIPKDLSIKDLRRLASEEAEKEILSRLSRKI